MELMSKLSPSWHACVYEAEDQVMDGDMIDTLRSAASIKVLHSEAHIHAKLSPLSKGQRNLQAGMPERGLGAQCGMVAFRVYLGIGLARSYYNPWLGFLQEIIRRLRHSEGM